MWWNTIHEPGLHNSDNAEHSTLRPALYKTGPCFQDHVCVCGSLYHKVCEDQFELWLILGKPVWTSRLGWKRVWVKGQPSCLWCLCQGQKMCVWKIFQHRKLSIYYIYTIWDFFPIYFKYDCLSFSFFKCIYLCLTYILSLSIIQIFKKPYP